MKHLKWVVLFTYLSLSMLAVADNFGSFYEGCTNMDPDYLAAMRWIRVYYFDKHPTDEKLKLECGKAFKFLLNTHSLKINFNSSLLQCPDATCKIHSIEFLKYFKNITSIELNGHRIQDLTPLTQLTHLKELSLEDNLIKDVTPLAELNELLVLNLHDNLVDDISPISQLEKLRALDISRNTLVNLPSDLSNLKHLSFFASNYNTVDNIKPLENLRALDILELDGAGIKSLENIDRILPRLQYLSLHHNAITDVTPLAFAMRMNQVDITMNQVRDLEPLAKLSELKEAELGGNGISFDSCVNMLHERSDAQTLCASIKHWENRF